MSANGKLWCNHPGANRRFVRQHDRDTPTAAPFHFHYAGLGVGSHLWVVWLLVMVAGKKHKQVHSRIQGNQ